MHFRKNVLLVSCIPLFALLMSLYSYSAVAKDQGHGTVTMNGAIIDSACSVDTNSRYQTIDMLSQPISEIISEGSGLSRPFSIKLINCQLSRTESHHQGESWSYFQVTFDGENDSSIFGLTGDAQGVALEISDEYGNVATPGIPMPSNNIEEGSMEMKYKMRLMGNREPLKSGEYHTTVRYKIDYY